MRQTFGANLAVDEERGGAGGQAAGGEEADKRVPGERRSDVIGGCSDEVAVEFEGIRVEPECAGYGPEVQFLVIYCNYFDFFW